MKLKPNRKSHPRALAVGILPRQKARSEWQKKWSGLVQHDKRKLVLFL